MHLRPVLLSAAAIVLLGVAALVVVARSSRTGVHAGAGAGTAGPEVATPARPSEPAGLAGGGARPPEPPAAARSVGSQAVETVPPPAAPTAGAAGWREVPVVARASELGTTVAGSVHRGLEAARDRLDPCFEEDARRVAGAAPGRQSFGPAVLTLALESRAGAIVVVDAELDDLGRSSRELVECCTRILRGHAMPAPEAPPGERYRLKYLLQ